MSGDAEIDITRAVVVCDGAAVPRDFQDCGWDMVPVRSRGHDGELNLRADNLGTHYLGRLDERANDLVRIAAFAFAADQHLSRGGKGDPHRRRWRRELALCVPVADPAFWGDEDTVGALSESLGFGTEDRWEFAFSPSEADDRRLQLGFDVDARDMLADPDCVALFFGGIDSLCATVEAVASHQRRPVLVSHRTAPHVAAPQQRLMLGLETRFPAWLFPRLNFWIHRRGPEAVERTRRTRGFLVASLGAAVAGQVRLPTVLLADNGYVSVNPPVNAQLVGALNSRGTHPVFLRLVNRLLGLVFPFGVQLENPLERRTRAKALALLTEHGCEPLLRETHSCSKSRQPAEKPHCGVCSQCVDRRFATIAAGLEAFDPPDRYGVDIFTAPLPAGEPRVFAMSYVGHAQRVDALRAEEVFYEYPELEACLDLDGENIPNSAASLAGVLKRHADEVLDVIGTMVSRHGNDFARGRLPESCLLWDAIKTVQSQRAGRANEALPQDTDPPAEEHPSGRTDGQERPRFEKTAGSWLVTFAAEKGYFKHSVGMARLARLLKAPGRELSALDLFSGSVPGTKSRKLGFAADGPDQEAMGTPGRLGAILSRDSKNDLRRHARELQADLANARAAQDDARCVTIRAELEEIAEVMHSATGLHGRARTFTNEDERARQSVSQTIGRALSAIEQQMPELRLHFRDCLHLGYSCTYNPRPRLDWDVNP